MAQAYTILKFWPITVEVVVPDLSKEGCDGGLWAAAASLWLWWRISKNSSAKDTVMSWILHICLQDHERAERRSGVYARESMTTLLRRQTASTEHSSSIQALTWHFDVGDTMASIRPPQIVPPLRPIGVGEIGDRWALDIAGPMPMAHSGKRFVTACLEYVSRFVAARATYNHSATTVTRFLMEEVVFKYGPFRELMSDQANEFLSETVHKLAELLQAKQTHPVPYRPNMMGLVERYNRTWKDAVAIYVDDQQKDGDEWLPAVTYAYNTAVQTSTRMEPSFLMTGRVPKSSGMLLRPELLGSIRELPLWHGRLVRTMRRAHESAKQALALEQKRQAHYYNRKVRNGAPFNVGDEVWIVKPPMGKTMISAASHPVHYCLVQTRPPERTRNSVGRLGCL